jgi:ribosomal-protein-alanine N-acetyltransferase
VCLNILISPLTHADIPYIVEIEKHSQPEPWSSQSFVEELSRLHSHLLVAKLVEEGAESNACPPYPPGGIVGYICYWSVADEIQILNIAVHWDFRRKSIGSRLLSDAIRTGREKNAGVVTLEVRKSNAPARILYESFGFRAVGERPNYYGAHGEAAVLMELEINLEEG